MKGHLSRVNLVKREFAPLKDFTPDQCPFISICKQKNGTSIFIVMLNRQITPKSRKKKSMSILWSRDRCLAFENICNGFLMLHRMRMTSECKYELLWEVEKLNP